jgi:cytosine/adenosine deaminase-related metal-dependent hydrolase
MFRNGHGQVARTLLGAATAVGADSLGVEAGRIAQGLWADFAVIDLNSLALAGATPDTLLDALVFGADSNVVTATCVGGQWMSHRALAVGR